MPSVKHKRGTRVQIDVAGVAGQLKAGEIYLITDENRLTVGTSPNTHQAVAKQGEGSGSLGFTDLTDAAPANPAVDTVRLFRKSMAGRHIPGFKGSGGQDSALQSALHGNAIFYTSFASGTTVPNCIGGTVTGLATISQAPITATTRWTSIQRKRTQTATTVAKVTGFRTAYTQWWRGNAAGSGGFFWRSRFGHQINLNGAQAFHGLCGSVVALGTAAGSVNALINSVGMGYDTTDLSVGNWFLYRNDATGAAVKLDLGLNAARSQVTDGFELMIFCLPHNGTTASNIFVEIKRISDNATVLPLTEFNDNLPVNTTFLGMKSECNNGAVAAATNLELASIYIESDY